MEQRDGFNEIDFKKSIVVEFLQPFGGLGKLVAGVMQILGLPKPEREEVRKQVEEATTNGDPCHIVFEMGQYRYRVRIA